jgi:DNA-binding transcriptional ArsR family regulator
MAEITSKVQTMQSYLSVVVQAVRMVEEKLLFNPKSREAGSKRVLTSRSPDPFSAAFGSMGQKIVALLASKPRYPAEMARDLHTHHQTVYYHIRRLEKSGLITRMKSEKIRGGEATRFALSYDGYAVEFAVRGEPLPSIQAAARSRTFGAFFKEFVGSGSFDGWIIVGSPVPHGTEMTQGRDGHYAVQLGFAIGQFVLLPATFPVKLDVDLRTEKLEKSNLIILGGPRTNILTSELNSKLPIKFKEGGFWASIVDDRGRSYTSELDSLIVKIRNPWDESRVVIVVAGLSGAATKAAVIGLTNYADNVLKGYDGVDFACVLRGVDLDGDGKVDSVDLMRKM